MGCFLRDDFEEELKSSSQQMNPSAKPAATRVSRCRPSEMRQGAARSREVVAAARSALLREPTSPTSQMPSEFAIS